MFRNNSEKTLLWYRDNLQRFISWLPSDTLDVLTIEYYKKYVLYLMSIKTKTGKRLKSGSVSCYTRPVKAFYNYLIEEELIADISRKLKVTKVIKDEIEILSDDEIKALMSCFGDDILEIRNKCWCALMLDSGLRRGECLSLKTSDVDLLNKVLLVSGKGRKKRYVPLGSYTSELLQDYKKERISDDEHFFVDRFGRVCSENAIKLVFSDLKKKTGILRLHPHLLRHTFATNYLLSGGDLERLRLILGHSDLQITEIYLHLADNKKLIQEEHRSYIDSSLKLGTPFFKTCV